MTRLSDNIKFLRKKERMTQEQFAEAIEVKRSLIGAYEEGRADPRLNNLLKMADVFDTTVDTLLKKDVTKLSEWELAKKEGEGLKVLSITVDKHDKENIEMIPQKAAAGYLNGYADPQYLEELPKFQLPVLPDGGTYRAFEISGDSMLPLESGTVVVGRYVDDFAGIKNGQTYVIITRKEGVVYKRVFNYVKDKGCLFLVSDNQTYAPFEVPVDEVIEVWESKAFISVAFPNPHEDEEKISLEGLASIVLDLQNEVKKLSKK